MEERKAIGYIWNSQSLIREERSLKKSLYSSSTPEILMFTQHPSE